MSHESDSLVGHDEGAGVQFAQRLLLDRVAMEGSDTVTNPRVADRKAETLAASDPLLLSLLSSERRRNRKACLFSLLQDERTLNGAAPCACR